jgi:outer membrane lipoprotein LolB
MRRLFLISLALALAALGGCSTVAPLPGGERRYLDELTLAGRLSIRYPVRDQTQSVQGKFLWHQRRDGADVELYSPLGQTLARIALRPGRATLEQANGVRHEAASAGELTEKALGWPLPVDGMRFWLQGFVRDAGGKLQAALPDDAGRYDPAGWALSYPGWQAGGGQAVPKRIDIVRGGITVRIAIDDWQPGK